VDIDNTVLKIYGLQSQQTDVKLSNMLIHLQIQNYLKFFIIYLPGGYF